MKRQQLWHRWCLASVITTGIASTGWAQQAPVKPVPEIEVFVGTVKVAPVPPPPAPIIIVQEAPKPKPKPEPKPEPAPKPRVEPPVFVPIIPAGAWGPALNPAPLPGGITRQAESVTPTGNTIFHLISQLMSRLVQNAIPADDRRPISTPQIVILREPASESRSVAPAPVAPPPSPPQIVVVREPAPPAPVVEPKPVSEPPSGLQISWELAGMIGFAVFGLLCLVFSLGRGFKRVPSEVVPAMPAAPAYHPETDGPLLQGQYKVGPLPETAERFDLGLSYQDEVKAKERALEAGKQAVVANILLQNLDLFEVGDSPEQDTPADQSR